MSDVKTVVIFETTDETVLFAMDGDLTKFEGVIINSTDIGLEDELADIELMDEFSIDTNKARELIINGALLVHCGQIY